jgi:tetratricopeptide (TPR) repeat protein
VNSFWIGLISAVVATNQTNSLKSVVTRSTGIEIAPAAANSGNAEKSKGAAAKSKSPRGKETTAINTNSPVELEYLQLLALDDAAQADVQRWLKEEEAFMKQGGGTPDGAIPLKIEKRLEEVEEAYKKFLKQNPRHARALLAYGSFLGEQGREEESVKQLDKAMELDPTLPSVWNNLANYYGHRGPVKKAFEYYAKATELDPSEAIYFHNWAVTVYLFRKDAMEHYKISETEVFDKALDLYRKAIKLDPSNFVLHSDYAQSFYGTKPPRWKDGLVAWQEAMPKAGDEVERQGVLVHYARIKMNLGQLEEARKDLNALTHEMYQGIRKTLEKKLARLESESKQNKKEEPSGKSGSEPDKENPPKDT